MISVEKASEIILNTAQNFGIESIPLMGSDGRILKENIVADRDFPPFNRVTMDGIAIHFSSFKKGKKNVIIEAIQPAGAPQRTLENLDNCIEVMTGAMLPKNTDTVIRYEDILIENGIAKLQISNIKKHQNIHHQGKDEKKGVHLISENTIISSTEIGVLATVGKSMVKVAKQPKVMVISTGDELVNINEIPLAHQIRKSNVFTVVSLLKQLKIDAKIAHISDNKIALKTKISQFLHNFDVLIFSGAVSKGKFDFLPEILDELNVTKLFHRVAQRPGKPFWFGKSSNCSVFAFPGNPVSTFVNCLVYFFPWYQKSMGNQPKKSTAILTKNITFTPNLTYFLQVELHQKEGQLFATPIDGNGSGDLASLLKSDGILHLPTTQKEFKKGEIFPLVHFR